MAEKVEKAAAEVYLWLYAPPHHDKVYLSQVVKGDSGRWFHVTAYARRGQPLNTRRKEFSHPSAAWDLHYRTVAEKQAKGYQQSTAAQVLAYGGVAPEVTVTVKPEEPVLTPKATAPSQRKIWELDDEV